jgi:hypothetical protein
MISVSENILVESECFLQSKISPSYIYPIELEIKDSTDTDRFASYLDLHLEIDNEVKSETLRQKRWLQCSHCELSIYM